MFGLLRRMNALMNPSIEHMQQHMQARPRHMKFGPYIERYMNERRRE